jgi:predicted nucleic acid-binding protein
LATALNTSGQYGPSGTGNTVQVEKPKFVFDTNSAIYLLNGDSFADVNLDDTIQFVSVITRIELHAYPSITPEGELKIRSFLDGITVVPLNDEVEAEAIKIRRASKIKLPDCIIAATAIVLDAALLTRDDGLLKLDWPGLRLQLV